MVSIWSAYGQHSGEVRQWWSVTEHLSSTKSYKCAIKYQRFSVGNRLKVFSDSSGRDIALSHGNSRVIHPAAKMVFIAVSSNIALNEM